MPPNAISGAARGDACILGATLAVLLILMTAAARLLGAADNPSIAEAFGMAGDREQVVATLTPGSDEYCYYRCLLWQQQGKLDAVEQLVDTWRSRMPNSTHLARIQARQALLIYPSNHHESLTRLQGILGIHPGGSSAPETAEVLPNTLDPADLSEEAICKSGLASKRDLSGFTQAGIERFAGSLPDALSMRNALGRLTTPCLPHLVDLVVGDLQHPGSAGFWFPVGPPLPDPGATRCLPGSVAWPGGESGFRPDLS